MERVESALSRVIDVSAETRLGTGERAGCPGAGARDGSPELRRALVRADPVLTSEKGRSSHFAG
jgi:hypothetical protein